MTSGALGQAGLGRDLPGPRTDRLFFALYPDAATAARIAQLALQLRAALGLSGWALKTERLHVTLHHLGDHSGLLPGLVEAAKSAAASMVQAPFELRFDRARSLAGRGKRVHLPFVLLADPVMDGVWSFQRALGRALTRVGLDRPADQAFTPHVTLLYDDQPVAEQPVTPVSWMAGEFVLVHSLLGKSVHIPLERWSFKGDPA